jgi:hypothetical protein
MSNESKALELADSLESDRSPSPYINNAAAELRRQHTALQDLQTECTALRVNEENLMAQVESLRAQLAARVAPGEPFGWWRQGNDLAESDFYPASDFPEHAGCETCIPLYTHAQQASEPMTYKEDSDLCEAHCNTASEAYFKARPQLDSDVNRRIFYAGHRKAWIAERHHNIKGKQ